MAVLDKGQNESGAYFYQLYNHTVLGDPALQLHLQRTDLNSSARASVNGKNVTLVAPETWQRFQYVPLEEWGCKFPQLFSWRGAGVGVENTWYGPEKRNQETYFYTAEVHTKSKVSTVKPVGKITASLGWTGACYVDHHADGSRSLFWRVKFFDGDMTTGSVLHQADRLEFRLMQ